MLNEGYDGLITLDKNLPKQQNLNKFNLKIIILRPIDSLPMSVQPLIEKLRSVVNNITTEKIIEIE